MQAARKQKYFGYTGQLATVSNGEESTLVEFLAGGVQVWQCLEVNHGCCRMLMPRVQKTPDGSWLFGCGSDAGVRPKWTNWNTRQFALQGSCGSVGLDGWKPSRCTVLLPYVIVSPTAVAVP